MNTVVANFTDQEKEAVRELLRRMEMNYALGDDLLALEAIRRVFVQEVTNG